MGQRVIRSVTDGTGRKWCSPRKNRNPLDIDTKDKSLEKGLSVYRSS